MRKLDRILVVGAGIAGCCTAIALAARGFAVRLIEKQGEWRFQSSGIFVYSNGLSNLNEIGVLDHVLSAGYVIENGRNVYLDHFGNHLADVFYPAADQGRVPAILGIKRGELHRVLANKLEHFGLKPDLGITVRRGRMARRRSRVKAASSIAVRAALASGEASGSSALARSSSAVLSAVTMAAFSFAYQRREVVRFDLIGSERRSNACLQ